ncbi:PX_domain-containing protein [Hexamita inflata]|uniref:PX domain-containing protein n=1 Tax=Hexamita inflata TaxID=28002 RepID=A0AA86TAT6_9EUKA|nr:PX domain-containing protein [Hexamita inflata]
MDKRSKKDKSEPKPVPVVEDDETTDREEKVPEKPRSPTEIKMDDVLIMIQPFEEFYPQLFDQVTQILEKLQKEVDASQADVLQVLSQIETTLQQKIIPCVDLKRKIKKLREQCTEHMTQLEKLGLETQMKANWGLPVTPQHIVKNVSKVIVDDPQSNHGGIHNYIDYRVIVRCELPNRTADSEAIYIATRRRFNDLKALSQKLESSAVEAPPLPQQKHFLMGGSDAFFIAQRRIQMAKWITAVAQVPDLVREVDFQEFCLGGAEWRYVEQGLE